MTELIKKKYSPGRLRDLFFCFITALIITLCSAVILTNADWTIGDDFETLQTTASGYAESICRHIGQEKNANGRFYPLGHYDLNLLVFVPAGKTAAAHYVYIWLQFLLLVFLFWKLLSVTDFNSCGTTVKASTGMKTAALLLFVSSPGFLWVFTGVNFPERLLMVLYAFSMLMFIRGKESRTEKEKNMCYAMAAAAALYASYMKEPVSSCFCIFAASCLIFSENIEKKEKFFHVFLLINCIVFFVLYYFLALRGHTSFYVAGEGGSISHVFLRAFAAEKTVLLVFALAAFRFFRVVCKKERNSIFTDSLLFAGAGYNLTFIVLKLAAPYYFTPALLLSMPAFLREMLIIRKNLRIVAMAVAGIIIISNAGAVYRHVLMTYTERTTHMPVMRTVAEHIKSGGRLYWYVPQDIPRYRLNMFVSGQRHLYNVFTDYAGHIMDTGAVPGDRENFITVSDYDEIIPADSDIFFLPLYRNTDGRIMHVPEHLLKSLEQAGFGMLRCDLVHVRIFLKKGSYIEKNWYLKNTGTVPGNDR